MYQLLSELSVLIQTSVLLGLYSYAFLRITEFFLPGHLRYAYYPRASQVDVLWEFLNFCAVVIGGPVSAFWMFIRIEDIARYRKRLP